MNIKTKLILGQIFTCNTSNDWVEAMVVQNNKIVFAGSKEKANETIDSETEVLDYGERLILPGFIDSHAHFMMGGASLNSLDLMDVRSKEEFIEQCKKYKKKNNTEWILGGNWNHQQFSTIELPNKNWVDDFTNDVPLFLTRSDLHMGLANSKVLALAGINKNTADPEGGVIEKDQNGELTGILKDAAMTLVYDIIPPKTENEMKKELYLALDEAKKNGITSVHDITTKDSLKLYQKFIEQNKLSCRIYVVHPINEIDNLIELGVESAFGNNFLKIGSLKAFVDGSLGSFTAWFFEPYSDNPELVGLPMGIVKDGRLRDLAIKADKAKLQLVIHGIGDRAIKEIIDVYEEVCETNAKWDRRHRIEHVQHIRPQDIPRLREKNIIASVQPYQVYDDGDWCESKIGKDRLKGTYAFKSLIENKVKMCFGSDWTVTQLDAISGIWCAVTRETKSGQYSEGWIPEEKISVIDAVRGYTIDAAYASYEENIKGSIEASKLADFVVLDTNIIKCKPEEIRNAKVDVTILDGNIIYERD